MKNKIIIIISLIICFIAGILFDKMVLNKKNDDNIENNSKIEKNDNKSDEISITDDSRKFKEEYEKLNGTIDEFSGETYNTVNIDEDNPIEYINLEELYNVINSDENAYIYISTPTCTYCRASIETLLKTLKDIGVDKLYYYDISSSENSIEEQKRNEIMNKLAEQELVTLNEDGNENWSVPLIARTLSGEVLIKEVGTAINYNEGQAKNSPLTEEQKQELYDHYYELLKK